MPSIALFLGVNQYEDSGIASLSCAERDARDMEALFKRPLGYDTEYLEDRSVDAIQDCIVAAGQRLHSGDTFVFYFAGHGKQHGDDQLFLLPRVRRSILETGATITGGVLSWRTLRALTEEPHWAGVRRLFIFDACRSPLESTRDGGQARYQGEALERDIKLATSNRTITTPLTVLNSCSKDQCALEIPGKGHGVFSVALMALLDQAAKTNQSVLVDQQLTSQLALRMREITEAHGISNLLQEPKLSGDENTQLFIPQRKTSTPNNTDERKWLLLQDDLEELTDPEEKIRLLRAHIEDPSLPDCCHVDEARQRIKLLKDELRKQIVIELRVPDIGGADATVIDVWVQAGDTIAVNDSLITLETDKATMEIPATTAGVVKDVKIKVGDKASEGMLMLLVDIGTPLFSKVNFNNPFQSGEIVPKLCGGAPEMVAIPPGRFLMGSPSDELGRGNNENPQHEVQIRHWLAVGKYAVTFDEWDLFIAETTMCGNYVYQPEDAGWGRGKRPVINISWCDAQRYIDWLNKKADLVNSPYCYRLLSDAEWEYACRAGTTTAFWWGDGIGTDQANYNGNDRCNGSPEGEYRREPVPVDSFAPNPWGLYQMHGNVWEWVQDGGIDNYTSDILSRKQWRRTLRGGSWNSDKLSLRSAVRANKWELTKAFNIGFRIARTLPSETVPD